MRTLTIGALLMMLAAIPSAAQDVIYRARVADGGAAAGQGDVFTVAVPPPGAGGIFEKQIGVLAVEPFEGVDPIAGAPYSADITTDVVQQLADGNRIEHHTTSSVVRDGQGRVRREQQLTAIGPILPKTEGRFVTIVDPVAHVHYSLDPMRKVAMKLPLPPVAKRGGAMAQGALPAGDGQGLRTESLGTANIEGVQAQGTRTVVTIPAGAVGNQAPIEMVTEQWLAPELGVVVMSRRSDPRFGETTYRLQNIVRTEPSPELFQVPADYTEEALPAFGAGTMVTKPLLP